MRPAAVSQGPPLRPAVASPAPPVRAAQPALGWLEFASYLTRKYSITGNLLSKPTHEGTPGEKKRRELGELTDLSANDFADEVARFYDLPRLSLPQLIASSSLTGRFSPRFLRDAAVFPCRIEEAGGNTLVITDPNDLAAVRAAQLVLGEPVALRMASFEHVAACLSARVGEDISRIPDASKAAVVDADSDIESLRDLASGAPVVRAVNDLLEKAVEMRATDIHIEPFRAGLSLRMRVDGLLREVPTPAGVLPQALISRIKILSGLNIAERRLPQDGAAHLPVARWNVDIRVATMPTQYGESAVVRLLPKGRGVLEIAKLGLSDPDRRKLNQFLGLPHGMIVVTGPTGSGKTTTLATMLTALNDKTRKILTIEDPVEYEIAGVNQSQVKTAIGLSFAAALRAFARQDPDVIMVGEVRDSETAHIAIHAALTGHLVLTTLHTETAAAAVPRLIDLGIEGFLLKSTLRAVVAQRLVRMLCDRCKVPHKLTAADIENDPRFAVIGFNAGETIHEAGGCERCGGTGYRGRNGVFEILEMSDEVRKLIGPQTGLHTIDKAGTARGTAAKRAGARAQDR